MYGRVWEWKDTSAAWLTKRWGERGREREEWYGQTAVAMGTQLLKAGRVSEEEGGCVLQERRAATQRPDYGLHKQREGLTAGVLVPRFQLEEFRP